MSSSGRDTIEAAYFKPTTGGFVFQAPKPWVFGEAHHYLVTEVQKAEILSIMVPDVPAWRRAAIIGALIFGPVFLVLLVATLLWAAGAHDEPTVGVLILMFILIAGLLLLTLFVIAAWSAQVHLANLAPLIAQLAPTGERITAADRRHGTARTTSF